MNEAEMSEKELKWHWINPYINLIKEKESYIIAGERDTLNDEQIAQIRERCKGYERVICEICCGSGGHLVNKAEDDPEALYIGFELRFKRAFNVAKKAERLGLKNLLVVRSDAHLLPKIFPEKSLAGVYINFPDPWDHEKWKKFRVLKPEYFDMLPTIIKDGGFFSYKTDHDKSFKVNLAYLEQHPHYEIVECSHDLYAETPMPKRGTTEFEKMFVSKGMTIKYLKCLIK